MIQNAKNGPNNVRWAEFANAIQRMGFCCEEPHKDSHWMVVYTDDGWRLSVPVHNDKAKGFYIKKILEKIGELEEG